MPTVTEARRPPHDAGRRRSLATLLGVAAWPMLAPHAWAASSKDAAASEKLPPLRVQRREGCVEMDNGLVKARFTAGNDGVKQEYLASRGRKWILLAEGFRPDGKAKPKFEVFADFENAKYGSWQTEGEAFGAAPSERLVSRWALPYFRS